MELELGVGMYLFRQQTIVYMAMQCFVLKHNHEIFILEIKNSLCSQLLTLYRGSSHIMVSNPVLFQWPEKSNFPVLLFVVLLLLSSSDTLSFALLIFTTLCEDLYFHVLLLYYLTYYVIYASPFNRQSVDIRFDQVMIALS